jgi:hypothetical protein
MPLCLYIVVGMKYAVPVLPDTECVFPQSHEECRCPFTSPESRFIRLKVRGDVVWSSRGQASLKNADPPYRGLLIKSFP